MIGDGPFFTLFHSIYTYQDTVIETFYDNTLLGKICFLVYMIECDYKLRRCQLNWFIQDKNKSGSTSFYLAHFREHLCTEKQAFGWCNLCHIIESFSLNVYKHSGPQQYLNGHSVLRHIWVQMEPVLNKMFKLHCKAWINWLNITIDKVTVPWLLYNCTVTEWPLRYRVHYMSRCWMEVSELCHQLCWV